MASYVGNMPAFESVLIKRLRSADETAFHEVFKQFGQKIFRTAMKILKEEESAKDATQETLINIHRAVSNFRGDSKLSTWINRITVNVCLEMIRKNKKHSNRTEEDISENTALEDWRSRSPLEELQRTEIQKRVERALSRLSEKHSTVVGLHDLQGYTIREISEMVDVAEGTIKSRLFYGREELKRYLTN